ncbi:MAG TPA: BON domain-containing protein, partial [Nevskiaceae bacterium]|nr:BON domain-containing protein [Nevskiaceae bacterium]
GWRGDDQRFGNERSPQRPGWGDRDRHFQPEGGRYRNEGDRAYPDYYRSRGEYSRPDYDYDWGSGANEYRSRSRDEWAGRSRTGETAGFGGDYHGAGAYGGGAYQGGDYGTREMGGSDYAGRYGAGSTGRGGYGSGSSWSGRPSRSGPQQWGREWNSENPVYAGGTEAWDPSDMGMSDRSRQGSMPKGYTRSDERIKDDVCEQLYRCGCNVSEVSIDVKGGTVTLEGSVTDRRLKHRIEDIVEECIGVKDVENRIRVTRGSERQMGEGEEGGMGSSASSQGESSRRGGGSSKSAQH